MTRLRLRVAPGLLLAQAAVLLLAAAAAVLVAAAVGPPLFHEHLVRAGTDATPGALAHIEEAFASAGLITLAAALSIAMIAAVAVTVLLTRRLTRPLDALAYAAAEVASGRLDVRVEPAHTPAELATVTEAFNTMARDLDETDQVRARLLSDLAHELRTPLSTLTAYLDALDDGVTTATPDTVAVLREQVDRLTRLARDIRAVSAAAEESADALDLQPVPVPDLVESACAPLRTRLPDEVRLTIDVEPGLTVHADRDRIAQVLTNLLDNAARHTQAGHITVTADGYGDTVRIEVADTGDGIGAEHLPHVFERFYRSDSARDRDRGGSGLGLTICRAILRAHGGTITAASPGPGRGSTFTITLPATR